MLFPYIRDTLDVKPISAALLREWHDIHIPRTFDRPWTIDDDKICNAPRIDQFL